jgi:cation-transporting ATPase 13A1
MVIPPPHSGKSQLCRIKRSAEGKVYFEFQKIEFVYSSETRAFEEIKFPVDKGLRSYFESKGIESESRLNDAYDLFGFNVLEIPLPAFMELFREHAVAPFFVFQIFCVLLWMLDEYWYYSLMTLCMFIMFESMLVKRRLSTLDQIRNMRAKAFIVHVFRSGAWTRISSSLLVPGDLVSICRSGDTEAAPCDALLLAGKCVVNESLLTGESVPQIKEPPIIETDSAEKLEMTAAHKGSIVFSGTRVLSHEKGSLHRIPSPPDGGSIGHVLKTGFSTSQGSLIRTILFSTERVTVNNSESLLFILCLLVFAICASAYVLYYGLQDESRSRYKLLLNCIMIITSVVPPELPMELSLAVNASLVELLRKKIYCTEPFRIPFAGSVDICCFDKTGTLTSDSYKVEGIVPLKKSSLEVKEIASGSLPVRKLWDTHVSESTLAVVAGCNSLSRLGEEVIGDPLEKVCFDAAAFSLTRENSAHSKLHGMEVKVLHRFPFSSALKRMSCVVKIKGQSSNYTAIVSKGAPEVMSHLYTSVPSSFSQTCTDLSRQGFRILAYGVKKISDDIDAVKARSLSRDDSEQNLQFCGILVMHAPLKVESKASIEELSSSCHRVCMITGDHIFTACSIAAELGMTAQPCLMLRVHNDILVWSDEEEKSFRFDLDSWESLLGKHDLCIEGSALSRLQSGMNPKAVGRLIVNVKVFARVSPSQKEYILTTMKSEGFSTLMCGDGTNDVGALKQAHVGVALIEEEVIKKQVEDIRKNQPLRSTAAAQPARATSSASNRIDETSTAPVDLKALREEKIKELMKSLEEDDVPVVRLGDASIAAPFTSRVSNISCCLDIIRQGRCTLVTTMQMYKILALNCLISAYAMSVLFLDGVKLGDTQATVFGILLAVLYLGLSKSQSVPRLSFQRPRSSVFSWYMFLSIFGQFAIHLTALIITAQWTKPISDLYDSCLFPI